MAEVNTGRWLEKSIEDRADRVRVLDDADASDGAEEAVGPGLQIIRGRWGSSGILAGASVWPCRVAKD